MSQLFASLFFSRLLVAMLAANYSTFVLLNATHASVSLTPIVYLGAFALFYALASQLKPRKSVTVPVDKASMAIIGIMIILLVIPRITYLLDWLPGYIVFTTSDDYARLLEVLAMTGNSKYPLLSPSNTLYPFSFYYSSLYPFAILKIICPFLSIKESISISNFIYQALVLLSIYEISFLTLRDVRKTRIMIFLCSLFGGLDWIASGDPLSLWGHFEWWQNRFSGNTQISSFYTGIFWTIHHFLAAYSVVLAYVFLFYTQLPKWAHLKSILTVTLLLSSFYMSPFAFISAPIFIIIHYKVVWRKLITPYTFILACTAFLPLYIFMDKFPSQGFVRSTFQLKVVYNFYINKIISLPLYLLLVPIVEFMGIPFLLFFIWPRLGVRQRHYLVGASIFFLSTYFIAYSGANNYSMRGMLLPSFVLFWLFSQHWSACLSFLDRLKTTPRLVIISGLLLLATVGTVKESGGRLAEAIGNFSLTYHLQHLPLPKYMDIYANLHNAQDQPLGTVEFSKVRALPRDHIYELDKFIQGLDIGNMTGWERELVRKPFENTSGETSP